MAYFSEFDTLGNVEHTKYDTRTFKGSFPSDAQNTTSRASSRDSLYCF